MKIFFPKSCFFVYLSAYSLPFQLMKKSATHLGFKPLGNHYIKRKINSKKYKFQKRKRDVSPSLSYVHGSNNHRIIFSFHPSNLSKKFLHSYSLQNDIVNAWLYYIQIFQSGGVHGSDFLLRGLIRFFLSYFVQLASKFVSHSRLAQADAVKICFKSGLQEVFSKKTCS